MKDWYDEDEDVRDEDEEEQEEDIWSVMNGKRNEGKSKEEEPVLTFDEKVAISITKAHKGVARKIHYRHWSRRNRNHLIRLYGISQLKCSFNEFCALSYDNSVCRVK